MVRKELTHIIRDRRTMLITVLMPLVLLLLFGFAISTEVNNVRVVAVPEIHNTETESLLHRISVNPSFTFIGIVDPQSVESLIRRGEADAAVIIRGNDGPMKFRILVDASNPTSAQAATLYLTGILSPSTSPSPIIVRTLYNPEMKSAYNFVPGILGMIFILICAIMTSVSIVSEKETGTMNLLLVSPIKPSTIIFGKLVPYFLVSCFILSVMLTMSYSLLGIPFSESVIGVVVISIIYIILSLSIGLLVSTLVRTRLAALVVSAVLFMIPVLMLSGMIFPIDNFPAVLRYFSGIIPARWYISAMRKLMIQQLPFDYVLKEVLIIGGMAIVILTFAIRKFTNSTR